MLLLAGCSTAPEKTPFAEGKLPVAVSFHAMDQLAKAIGGDYVDIHVIIPDGEEPHDFQPKASDLTALAKARVLVLNGGDLENWAEKPLLRLETKTFSSLPLPMGPISSTSKAKAMTITTMTTASILTSG